MNKSKLIKPLIRVGQNYVYDISKYISGIWDELIKINSCVNKLDSDLLKHTNDNSVHYKETSIDHKNILNIGTYPHNDIDTHIDDSTIHFTDPGFITDIVDDTTPQLGGDLDVNGFKITSASNGDIVIQPNGTGNIYIGGDTNRTKIEPDGTLVFEGNATTWLDLDFPIIIRTAGPNIPVLVTTQGNLTSPQWQVNDYAVCERQELPHDAKLNTSTNQWHIHIETAGTDVTNRYIAFEIEWNYAQINHQYGVPATISSGDLLIPANTPTNTHLAYNIGNPFAFTGQTNVSVHVKARLKRVASVGAAPTNNPFCEMLQIHYEVDGTGSRQILSK